MRRALALVVPVMLLTALVNERVYGELITGVTATASSAWGTRFAENTVNGSGLVGDTHALGGSENFWGTIGTVQVNEIDRDPWIVFDLQEVYSLESVRVWNGYSPSQDNVKRAEFEVSLNGSDFTSIGERTFDLPTNPAQDFDLGGAVARFVRFDILENAEGTQFPFAGDDPRGVVALGEVQFFGTVPEPSSLALISVAALLGFTLYRKRMR